MKLLHWVQDGLASAFALFLLNTLWAANLRHIIERHGWNTLLTRLLTRLPSTQRWFWFAFGAIAASVTLSWAIPLIVLSETPEPIKTELRLQFFGGAHVPEAVGTPSNIYHWYAQFRYAGNGEEKADERAGPYWTIFAVLERSALLGQVTWKFSDPGVKAEVEDVNDRSFIFRANTPIPAGELVISGQLP